MISLDDIALVYLAEQTSPDDYKVQNLNIVEKLGAIWASFEAILHSFDILNRNRRMYDGKNVWYRIQSSDRIQDNLRKHGWFGEQDHPGQDYSNMALTAERVQKIHMPNRSHAIINPHLSKNLLVSTIETAGTEAGLGMARELVRGLIPSFSCRSIAIMKERNGKPYVEVKKIITYDWVLYPSHREAEMITKPVFHNGNQKVVLESASDVMGGSIFKEYSSDFCVPMNEFEDFKEFLRESDKNIQAVFEFCDDGITDITGFDPVTNNAIVESGRSKLVVNVNMETKKKVEDFLSSF